MKKAELIARVAEEAGLTRAVAKQALEAIFAQIPKTLKKEARFVLSGVGAFEVIKRAKRIARNPRTKEPVTVKAHKVIKFKAAKALKDLVN